MAAGPSIRDRLSGVSGALVLGVDGEFRDRPGLAGPSSPTLLVAPVTNALKTISADGFVTGSLNREQTWKVLAYHLDEATCHLLAKRDIQIRRIHQDVIDMGLTWQARRIDDIS